MQVRTLKPSELQSFFLFGPRGVGKSTLLKDHFKKKSHMWLNLLDPGLYLELNSNPKALLERWAVEKPEWVVIDEVQKVPELLDLVHHGIEEFGIKFALSGSSARKLKRGGANLLANRAATFHLGPFTVSELSEKFELNRALSFGMLPRFWSELEDPKEITRALYSYITTYLKEEVAAEQLVRDLNPFQRFLVSAAQCNAQIVNHAKIERDADIGNSQAQRHFQILEDTLIGSFLPPYAQSVRKRQSQKSKFYFFDTGVVRALLRHLELPLNESNYLYGNLFETFFINEVLKEVAHNELPWTLSYLKTKSNLEVDLIIERPGNSKILIEIKSTKKLKEDHLKTLELLEKDFPKAERMLVSRDETQREVNGIQVCHWKNALHRIFN